MYLFFVLVVLYAVIGGVGAQSDGWKMTDRCVGLCCMWIWVWGWGGG